MPTADPVLRQIAYLSVLANASAVEEGLANAAQGQPHNELWPVAAENVSATLRQKRLAAIQALVLDPELREPLFVWMEERTAKSTALRTFDTVHAGMTLTRTERAERSATIDKVTLGTGSLATAMRLVYARTCGQALRLFKSIDEEPNAKSALSRYEASAVPVTLKCFGPAGEQVSLGYGTKWYDIPLVSNNRRESGVELLAVRNEVLVRLVEALSVATHTSLWHIVREVVGGDDPQLASKYSAVRYWLDTKLQVDGVPLFTYKRPDKPKKGELYNNEKAIMYDPRFYVIFENSAE